MLALMNFDAMIMKRHTLGHLVVKINEEHLVRFFSSFSSTFYVIIVEKTFTGNYQCTSTAMDKTQEIKLLKVCLHIHLRPAGMLH